MNVSVIARVSGNYSHLNWKWSSSSIPFDKQMTMSCHSCWGQLSSKARATAGVGPNTLRTQTRVHTHVLQPWIVFPSSSAPSRMLLLTPGSCFPLSQLWFHLLPAHLTSGLWVWAAGQCHKDRSVLSLTSTAALKSNIGWSGHLSAGRTRGLVAP